MASTAATYISATSFSVVGDETDELHIGRRVKCVGTSDWFGTILTSVYTSLTTVTLTADSDDLEASLTEMQVGIISGIEAKSSMPIHTHDGDEGSGGAVDPITGGTDNTLIRGDGTTDIQDSGITISDTDDVVLPATSSLKCPEKLVIPLNEPSSLENGCIWIV